MKGERAKADQRTIPSDIISIIAATDLVADVFPVDKEKVVFDGQVLKVNTLVFRPNCKLILTSNKLPWLAVVARTIKFAAPDEVAEIVIPSDNTVTPPPEHSELPPAPAGAKGAAQENGTAGEDGIDGLKGIEGMDGAEVPAFYLLADSIRTQPEAGSPSYIALTIYNRGRLGAEGGRGQRGQDGGSGGDGGNGVWSDTRLQCIHAARSGGPGGNAGTGGDGGDGGKGGNGGVVHFGGSSQAIDLLEFSNVKNMAGSPGIGNSPGENGSPGKGGARGSRPGQCTGGERGPDGAASPRTPAWGKNGQEGQRGVIASQIISISSLF